MKKLLQSLLLIGLVCTNVNVVFSKEKKRMPSVSYNTGADSLLDLPDFLKEYLDYTTSRHFQDPSIPRFLLKDRNENFIFGIGGYVGAIAYYDYDNKQPPNFNVNAITVPRRGYHNDIINLDMGSSRLFFKLIGKTKLGMINAYIEADFDNNDHYLGLRQAYVEMFGFKVGQAWTVFMDSESPNVIDMAGPVNSTARILPQIKYSYVFKNGMSLAAALEFSQSTSSSVIKPQNVVIVDNLSQRFPDLPISFTWDAGPLHLFAGINTRILKYSEYSKEFESKFVYATQISGDINLYKGATFTHKFYLQGTYTRGMADCIQDLEGMGLNIVEDRSLNDFYIMQAWAGHLAYQMLWGKNQINAIYSIADVIYPSDMSANLYKRGQFAAVNYIRKFLHHARVGLEGVYGRRVNLSNEFGMDFRINMLLRYDF